jgi:putative aminopeptidase FrvX
MRPRRDRFGNLYVGYRRGNAAPLAFTAHMDHPGFEVRSGGRRVHATLLGGIDPSHLRGSRVVLYHEAPGAAATTPARAPTPVGGRIAAVHTTHPPGARRPQVEVEILTTADVAL